ncbi:MAG: hypothetical protein SFW66_07080 [Gammaproteobacteria bacterium]|nr:hypothetical protein [Gammaproteobacteria bacterium]
MKPKNITEAFTELKADLLNADSKKAHEVLNQLYQILQALLTDIRATRYVPKEKPVHIPDTEFLNLDLAISMRETMLGELREIDNEIRSLANGTPNNRDASKALEICKNLEKVYHRDASLEGKLEQGYAAAISKATGSPIHQKLEAKNDAGQADDDEIVAPSAKRQRTAGQQ